MTTPSALEEPCRVEFCLSAAQKRQFEQAAALKGQTLTQWVAAHLAEDARRDIEGETTTWLPSAAFDEFVAALDRPLGSETRAFLGRGDRWRR
jgi:uncharacterized protein (DUF1778 family)